MNSTPGKKPVEPDSPDQNPAGPEQEPPVLPRQDAPLATPDLPPESPGNTAADDDPPDPALQNAAALPDEIVDALQDLIQVNLDSYLNFVQAHEHASNNSDFDNLIREMSKERKDFATELQRHVSHNEEDATTDSSLGGELHRWWIDLKTKLANDELAVVLQDAARGEQELCDRYAELLAQTHGTSVHPVLVRQHQVVLRGLARIRALLGQSD